MIHYHGTPIGGPHDRAAESLLGRHAFISFAAPAQTDLVIECCQSFALDNGAFSAWKSGKQTDWEAYYKWVDGLRKEPGFDWACIPDVIDGTEDEQDALVAAWPFRIAGVPVWHMNESLGRLTRLASLWPRVAIGSTGAYATVGTDQWWRRMGDIMHSVCDETGKPMAKLHGLRMLDMEVFRHLPLSSADSTSAAFNSHVDAAWKGTYEPPKPWRTRVLMARIEAVNGASSWGGKKQEELFPLVGVFERLHPSQCPEVKL